MFEVHAVNYRRRRGNVLILFALMVFGLFAMAALVIDIGIARVTQQQMQTAVDSAALEGLRYRDQLPPITESELGQEDEARRGHAANVVRWMFNSSSPFDEVEPINFGATTTVEYTDGVGEPDKYALQKLNIRNIGKPTLLPNINNEARGDMVSGHYIPEPASDATSAAIQDFHKEGSDYSRDDFEPAVGASTKDDAFLVRMRRTGEVPDTGILSAGPPLPYLFAWGTTFPRIRTVENPQILADGIKVRATSIAQVQNALSIGKQINSGSTSVRGLARFAIELTCWNELCDSLETNEEPESLNGSIFFFDSGLPDEEMLAGDLPTMIGKGMPGEIPPVNGNHEGYVPIFSFFTNEIDPTEHIARVIGFGEATINVQEGVVGKPSLVVGRVASENASAVLTYALPSLNSTTLKEILDVNRSLRNSLLAPVSVR